MLTLLSSVIGYLTSGTPKVLAYFQDKSDKKHELEVMRLQTEREIEVQKTGMWVQKEVAEIEFDRTVTEAQIRESEAMYKFSTSLTDGASRWIVNLRASVQPCVTYGLFILLVLVDSFAMWYAVRTGVEFHVALNNIWDEETQALWAAIVSFWFGSRQFNTKRK